MKTTRHPDTVAPCFGRRTFLKGAAGAAAFSILAPGALLDEKEEDSAINDLFWIKDIPDDPFVAGTNLHAGIESLLDNMAGHDLKFYQGPKEQNFSGPSGLIAKNDVVLVKVNAQWKYRGCTNSDVVRGLVQRILDHPEGFKGEVVILDNGQGRGSLSCNTSAMYGGNTSVQANANNRRHSYQYLAHTVFAGKPVSTVLLDPYRDTYIEAWDHTTNGYRKLGYVSYPCFTTPQGNRVELKEGIWNGSAFKQNLKLINVPVLKHHDVGGSEITASLKHLYGLLSMSDPLGGWRHYKGLGRTCGKMVAVVRTPVLNIIDAIWVSHNSITGNPPMNTTRLNQLMASQDPVALDFCAAKKILYPIDNNPNHHPSHPNIKAWLKDAAFIINKEGGLSAPRQRIFVGRVTTNENRMRVYTQSAGSA